MTTSDYLTGARPVVGTLGACGLMLMACGWFALGPGDLGKSRDVGAPGPVHIANITSERSHTAATNDVSARRRPGHHPATQVAAVGRPERHPAPAPSRRATAEPVAASSQAPSTAPPPAPSAAAPNPASVPATQAAPEPPAVTTPTVTTPAVTTPPITTPALPAPLDGVPQVTLPPVSVPSVPVPDLGKTTTSLGLP